MIKKDDKIVKNINKNKKMKNGEKKRIRVEDK